MFSVNGLYGHIRRNNAKTAVLASGFVLLFLLTHALIRLIITAVTLAMDRNPANWGLVGIGSAPGVLTWPMGAGTTNGSGVFAVSSSQVNFKSIDVLPPELVPPLAKGFGLLGEAMAHTSFVDLETAAMLVAGFAMVVWGTLKNAWFIDRATSAHKMTRTDNRPLFEMVDNLAISSGIPAPAIEIINSPAMNAYASGLTVNKARIGLTRGLIENLDRDELEAVIAHEMTHVMQADSRLMAVAKACLDIVIPYRNNKQFKTKGQILIHIVLGAIGLGMLFGWAVYLAFAAFFVGVTLFGFLTKALILHSREYVADAGAIELTKNPAALISALLKISGKQEKLQLSTGSMAIMIDGPDGGLFSTHPTIESRIEAIREHARVNGFDVTAHRNRQLDAVGGRKPGSLANPGFGLRNQKSLGAAAATHAIASEAQAIWQDAPVFGSNKLSEQTLLDELTGSVKSLPGKIGRGIGLYVAFIIFMMVGAPMLTTVIGLFR